MSWDGGKMCLIKEKATAKIGSCLCHFFAWALGLLLVIPIFILLFYFLAKEISRTKIVPTPDGAPSQISGDPKSFPSEKSLFLTSHLERNAEREGWS
jgi:hypothetical protein|tara:strand:- start:3618 stop:3908 length:291 start_codon:yes stop_codon:yes gene_type:complete